MANNVTTRPPARHDGDRELHPAITDTMARFSAVWEDNDRLVKDNQRLASDNEVLRRVNTEQAALIIDLRAQIITTQTAGDERISKFEAHYRSRLMESERAKEFYLKYAVSLSERLQACADQINAAHTLAVDMAHENVDMDREIGALVHKMPK